MYPVYLMMKMCQFVIRQCEGYTQHKPEVINYCEPFRKFCTRSWECMLQGERFEEITTIAALLWKFCWLMASMLYSLNFVKFMGNICKVFAFYKQVRVFMAFLYQIHGILILLSSTINFWYLSKDSVLTVPKTSVVLSNGICLTLCHKYILNMDL